MMVTVKTGPVPEGRLRSLDALRGADMILIMGVGQLFRSLDRSYENSFFGLLAKQFEHTAWQGFHLYDMIFPLFIFIVGVSMPFALSRRIRGGQGRRTIYLHIVKRSLLLFLFGLVFNGLLDFDFSDFGYTGVLQRISIAYFFSALIVLNTNPGKQAIIAGGLLILYWLLMMLVPVPGYGAGVITPEGNLHAYLDRLLLPGKLYNVSYDEDGLLQQVSSVAVCLAGVQAGHWLRGSRSQNHKALGLVAGGSACIAIALVWNLHFPVIFRLWSSSFAMLTIGLSAILLALFYWIIDVRGHRRWAFPFVVVGMNSITIYMVQALFDFGIIAGIFVHGFAGYLGSFEPAFLAICLVAVKWLFLYFLYVQKIFLKV